MTMARNVATQTMEILKLNKDLTNILYWKNHTQNHMSSTMQKKEIIESDIEYKSLPRKFVKTVEIAPSTSNSLNNTLPGKDSVLFQLPLCLIPAKNKLLNNIIYLNNICISEINESQKNGSIKWSLYGFGQKFETIEQESFDIIREFLNIKKDEVIPFFLSSNNNYLPVVSRQEYYNYGMVIIAESKLDISNIKIKVDIYDLILDQIDENKYYNYIIDREQLINYNKVVPARKKKMIIDKLIGLTTYYFNKTSEILNGIKLLSNSHYKSTLYIDFLTSHIIINVGNYDITNVKLILNNVSVNIVYEKNIGTNNYIIYLTENKKLINLGEYDGINFSSIDKVVIEFDIINYKDKQDVKIFSIHGQLMKVFGKCYGQMYNS
jgi:hypothetical protein